MARLILTVGLPRSGKSSWARYQGCPVVNPDSIRLALSGQVFAARAERFVWATAHVMVRSLFGAGHDQVILDATNGTCARRQEWKSDDWETVFKVFPADRETCIARAIASASPHLVNVIERMAGCWEPLDPRDTVLNDELNLPNLMTPDRIRRAGVLQRDSAAVLELRGQVLRAIAEGRCADQKHAVSFSSRQKGVDP